MNGEYFLTHAGSIGKWAVKNETDDSTPRERMIRKNKELADWLAEKAKVPGRRVYLSRKACGRINEIAHRLRNCASWYDEDGEDDCDRERADG